MLTQIQLKELLTYNEKTGDFFWKKARNGTKKGRPAGCVGNRGYREIKVMGKLYYAARLAWLYTTGHFPINFIDHKNGNPGDNRIENLRESSASENAWNRKIPNNSTSGFKCVTRYGKKWVARIVVNGKRIYLGRFETSIEAYEKYVEACNKLHGEFARTK